MLFPHLLLLFVSVYLETTIYLIQYHVVEVSQVSFTLIGNMFCIILSIQHQFHEKVIPLT
jgi:hypothetical protein